MNLVTDNIKIEYLVIGLYSNYRVFIQTYRYKKKNTIQNSEMQMEKDNKNFGQRTAKNSSCFVTSCVKKYKTDYKF